MIGSTRGAATPRSILDGSISVGDSVPARISTGASGEAGDPLRRRMWLIISCLSLVVLAFVTRPGNIIADTKIDLAINPLGFLGRALQLWDPAQFGQLQDQAVGYFFPVGPFFVVGKLMALPAWVVQRLWISALLLAAFLGTTRLTSRLGIGTPSTQVAAGFAYALAPRALGLLGILSGEFLPAAMLPWILLPLVRVVRQGRELGTMAQIRAVARSAVAVALCSGINAASVLGVLVPAGIYILTAPRPATRWRILALWVPAVILATWWWLFGLLLLGRYGVSVLTYTESAATTTSVTSLFNALRGAEDWVSYLVVNGQAWWPVAFKMATGSLPTILTGVIAGLGLTGLLRPGLPHRRFLLWTLLAGVAIILTGHVSSLGNPLGPPIDHALNGPLAPLRNIRKFDPMIRLPVAIGLADLLATARLTIAMAARLPIAKNALASVAAASLAILAATAALTGLTQNGDFTAFPRYWNQATTWLNNHAGKQAVLAVPGARFGEYTWGRPIDDVLEASLTGDWASRQLTYIGSVGQTRLLNAIDQQLAAGVGSPGLTQLLARMGVKYLVVRNDLIRSDLRGAWPARIHDALVASPGIVRVASFGGLSAGGVFPDDAVSAFDTPYPPVEIYQVLGAQPVVSEVPAAQTLRLYGGPEALLTLADQGLLRGHPVVLNGDSAQVPVAGSVLTDSLRRRVRNFGEIRVDYSPTMTASESAKTTWAATDYLQPGWQRYASTAQYGGIADITASSSDAGIGAIPTQSATGLLPFAAVDGDLRTMWESGSLSGLVGQWIKIDLLHSIDPRVIHVDFVHNRQIGPPVTAVVITTNRGRLVDRVRTEGGFQSIRVPAGPTNWLKLTVAGAKPAPRVGRQVGISEISIPGIDATRTIAAPAITAPGGAGFSAVVMSKPEPQPTGCMLTSLRWVCSGRLIRPTEEWYGFSHSFAASATARATLRGTAVLIDPSLADRYAFLGVQPRVTASSVLTRDPQDQPASAFDGNPATTWIASYGDHRPRLEIRWSKPRLIRRLAIARPPSAAGPVQVFVVGSGHQARGALLTGRVAHVSFRAMRTNSLTLYFTPSAFPLQVTDVAIPAVPQLKAAGQAPFRLPCGFGPTLTINGAVMPTKVSGAFADLLDERSLSFTTCARVRVRAGQNTVAEPSWDAFDVQAVVLGRPGRSALARMPDSTASAVRVLQWGNDIRKVQVSSEAPEYLVVNENFNAGWRAAIAGRTLAPVRLDGWKQAYLVPAGLHGVVTISYVPQASFRRNLLAGFGALGFVILVAISRPRGRRRGVAVPAVSPWPTSLMALERVRAGVPVADGHVQQPARFWPRLIKIPVVFLVSLGVLSAAGLWIGGYPGSVLLPCVTLTFASAIVLQDTHRICRELARPWPAAGVLALAAVFNVIGNQLSRGGGVGGGVRLLTDTTPSVLCIVVVARIFAALITAGPRGEQPDSSQLAGEHTAYRLPEVE
jgi:arabinofuranan 3-O-arabinosyltransferase